MEGTKLNFTGQTIYIGIDLGKKAWVASIHTEVLEHKTFSLPPKAEVLAKYLQKNFPGARYECVYEAGYWGFSPQETLTAHGLHCIVVNPADVPTKDKEKRTKTNRVDARKMARSLRNKELEAIYVPKRDALEDRTLVRMRYGFVQKETRCKNQIKALLTFYGIPVPEEMVEAHWSRRYIAWLESLALHQESGTMTLKMYLEELKAQRGFVLKSTRAIRALSLKEPYATLAPYLRSVKGIGPLSAMIFLTELIDINRFKNLDNLATYCGLSPGESSTGDEPTITGITPRRNERLRRLLIECAWVAVREDPALMLAFSKLSARMAKNKAIIRIARKLLSRIRFILKHQQMYQTGVVAGTIS